MTSWKDFTSQEFESPRSSRPYWNCMTWRSDIDVSRTTHTNLDVKQEKRIDDYWNIDGSRDLSGPRTGFTQITLL